jgi:hypothetical protein
MRNLHLLILSILMVITTLLMCSGHYIFGLLMLIITYIQAFLGIVSCLVNILEICGSQK